MRLLADLHTHTIASGHGFSTVTELGAAAADAGLELIAVTDHGPACPGGADPWYFWNMKVLPNTLSGVRILTGCEANPSSTSDNGLDLPDEVLEVLDFVAVGFHPRTGWDDVDPEELTEALLRVIEHRYVDMITHPGNEQFPVHMSEIVAAAAANDVILELNDHSFTASSSRAGSAGREAAFARAAHSRQAPVAICSDAHYHTDVGRFEQAIAVAEEIGIDESYVVNRDAASVLAHLTSKRDRPRLDRGGR